MWVMPPRTRDVTLVDGRVHPHSGLPRRSHEDSSLSWRAYDQFGKLVLKDPGNFRFSFDVDYGGTPGDPSDDIEIDDSFQVVRDSTGLNDTEGRDFCADVLEFTS